MTHSREYKNGYAQATADWAEVLERVCKRPNISLVLPDLVTALKHQAKEWQQEALK